jgi:metal-dependent HD superfamily phosphatase/phosphodiesterase
MSVALEMRPAVGVALGPESPAFAVPARRNPRLQALVERLNADEELWQLWRCANVNALDRLNLGDHGEVHARIVANAALRLLRLLREAGRAPGVVAHYHLPPEEAEVVVVLAAALHDIGLGLQHGGQWQAAAALAGPKARELLAPLYPPRERTILVTEALQAVCGHHLAECRTLEAGVLHLADALDIAEGRLQPPGREGDPANLPRVESVTIKKGGQRAVRVEVSLGDRAGVGDVSRLMAQALEQSALAEAVEIVGRAGAGPAFPLAPQAARSER